MTEPTTATQIIDIFADFAVHNDAVAVPYRGDVEFLIARDGNPRYKKRLTHLYRRNERVLDGKGDAADAKSEEIMIQVMAETILVGWTGTLAVQGQSLEYSVENAKKLLAVEKFREWVTAQSRDASLFKTVKDEEFEGN